MKRRRLQLLADAVLDNPILLKELRIGLRERKIFLIQTIYLLVLGVATALFLMNVSAPEDLLSLPEQGQVLHQILFWTQLIMVLFITPSLTCGQISGERENRSLELLRASRLRTLEIVAGKLAYALSYMGLLLVSSLPMVAVVFLLGGVSPAEVASSYAMLAVVAILSGLLGLFYSAREQRTGYATNQTYGTLILLFLASLTLVPLLLEMMSRGQSIPLGSLRLPVWAPVLFNAGCLAVFLFLKAQNHLRRRVSHELWMGRLFLLWYLVDCLLLGLWMSLTAADNEFEGVGALWCLGLVVALVAAGCFLRPSPFAGPREEERRRAALAYRWWFWVAVLASGLALAGLMQVSTGGSDIPVRASLGFCAAVILVFSSVTRALHSALGERPRFAALYYILLAGVLLLPMLPLASGESPMSFWLGAQLSPLPALWSLWSEVAEVELGGVRLDMATASLGTWLVLACVLLPALLVRRGLQRRRQPVAPEGG